MKKGEIKYTFVGIKRSGKPKKPRVGKVEFIEPNTLCIENNDGTVKFIELTENELRIMKGLEPIREQWGDNV